MQKPAILKTPVVICLAIAVLCLSCSGAKPNPSDSLPLDSVFTATYNTQTLTVSVAFASAQATGAITEASLAEVSGIVASQTNKGLLWVQEDSDNPNQIQLINENGAIQGTFTLPGIVNRDWEDIAVGPGPSAGVSYIYLADIGDNSFQYPTKTIYRFPEPDITGKQLPVQADVTGMETLNIAMPDGVKNAEALLVDPLTRDIYVIAKDTNALVYVARYPQEVTKTIVLKKLAVLPFSSVTAADISADGKEMLIKTYTQIFYFRKKSNESLTELLRQIPDTIPYLLEPQGEAIGFTADQSGFYTLSEKLGTGTQKMYFYKRK